MKLQFCPEDFENWGPVSRGEGRVLGEGERISVYLLAQRKVDKYIKEHGKVVYSIIDHHYDSGYRSWVDNDMLGDNHTHQAILINIEEIKKCEHPKEKVSYQLDIRDNKFMMPYHVCECGAKVYPIKFEVIE